MKTFLSLVAPQARLAPRPSPGRKAGVRLMVAATVASILAACASGPRPLPELDSARVAYDRVAADPLAREAAAQRLDQADAEIKRAVDLNSRGEPLEEVKHHAYLARRYVEIAEQQVGERRARQAVDEGRAARDRVLLEARSAEADRARTDAERAKADADQARASAEAARAQALSATADADKLRQDLSALQAQQTDRGMVLTLGDVLFDTGRAELQPGAYETLEKVATFLRGNAGFQVIVEGHTDSQGSDEYNLQLSERRAQAVRTALTGRGIDGTRIRARGLGEQLPVAGNSDAAGRQRNRRVEIVFSDANGEFPAAAIR
jgi:outer membrane protein OmpA-like peptidoglycan-associated protein